MLAQLLAVDKVSIVALAKGIESTYGTRTISELASKLAVPLMCESRNRRDLVGRLTTTCAVPPPSADGALLAAAKRLIAFLLSKTGAQALNAERRSFAPWLKDFLVDLKGQFGISYVEMGVLTGISAETLEGFAGDGPSLGAKATISAKHEQVAAAWHGAGPRWQATLDDFWRYLGRRHQELAVSLKEVRQILIDLGLRYPRGPKIDNHGAQVKRPFAPHAIWEGDAKQMKVRVNGQEFIYHWYAFVDQATTLLVGSTIGERESAAEFLAAARDGRGHAGTFPIGILVDNRLEGSDLGPIQDFCREHGIVLLRIFPGNSKTNGNIENNFSVFERFVGALEITGDTADAIARSVAQAVVEVFTQLRNHRGRDRLRGKSPADEAAGSGRPEDARNAIERMAARFARENRQIDEKWQLIADARKHFGAIDPGSEKKLKHELGKYPVSDIIAAQAAYLAQIVKHPDRRYGPEYFLAIVRHKRETQAKRTYNEAYRAGVERGQSLMTPPLGEPLQVAQGIVDLLVGLWDEPSPTHQILKLDALCWWLVGYGARTPQNSLQRLWRLVGDVSERTHGLTLRRWSVINEYVYEHLGELLDPPRHNVAARQTVDGATRGNNQFDRVNLSP